MRLIGTRQKEKVGGYYIRDATSGFWGEKGEGHIVLEAMGLPSDKIPFSMAFYLKNRHVQWKDTDGNLISISFCITEQRIEFFASYMGKRKTSVLFREWETYEDMNDIQHLESEAIGNMSMMCIYEKLIDKKFKLNNEKRP